MTEVRSNELREALAALCHQQWSEWMRYLYEHTGVTALVAGGEGRVIHTAEDHRWRRRMKMSYSELPEELKDGNRAEADCFLALFREYFIKGNDKVRFAAMEEVIDSSKRVSESDGNLCFAQNLEAAIRNWCDAEMTAQAARLAADRAEAKALQQVCHPEFVHPDGAKLTNEAARKAYAMEQALEDNLAAGVLEAHARALRFWVEHLVGHNKLILQVAEEEHGLGSDT